MEADKLTQFIQEMVRRMAIECTVVATHDEAIATTTLAIEAAQDGHVLIGKDGQNLKALEHIARIAAKRFGGTHAITIDINSYRKARSEQLGQLVRSVAAQVRDSGKPQALDPMSAYERRIVHTELAAYSDLATESVGQDPQRRVVIKPL